MIFNLTKKALRGSGLAYSALVLAIGSTPAVIAEEQIEEVVVTGSYLKRSAEDSPSPLSVVSSADIDDLGAQSIADVIQTLPWQTGSVSRSSTFGGEGGRGSMTLNLRNLGTSSTLVLLNGKRNVSGFYDEQGNAAVDVNALIPNIALERMEIVKDGASALYGSDAVAVVDAHAKATHGSRLYLSGISCRGSKHAFFYQSPDFVVIQVKARHTLRVLEYLG